MDPETIINKLLMQEEEDGKTAIKKQIGEFITNWDTREPPSLSGYEEVFPLESIKIEPDSDTDEGVSSTHDDSPPPSYPPDVKPILVNYSLEEEHTIRELVVKIRNISKYLVTTEQDVENITEGFSVDLENIKDLLHNSVLNDDVPVCDKDKYKYGDVRCKTEEDYTDDCDDGYNDEHEVDDDESYGDDCKDEDYKVEEEEEEEEEDYSESDEERLESSDEDYGDNIEDDDWKPHQRSKKYRLVKGKWSQKGALRKYDRVKGNFDSLDEGFAKRPGKPGNETKPEVAESLDNSGDAVLETGGTCDDTSVDLADSSRVTSSTFSTCEKSCENPGSEEGIISVQMASSDYSVVSEVGKALKSHPSSGSKEAKGDCGDDSGVEVITVKQRKKRGNRPQEKQRKKMAQCTVCDKIYTKQYLKIHTRIHTGERPFKCDICGKAFVRSFYLRTHRQRHSKERSYLCEVCGKGFHTKSGLSAHKSVHSDKKRFKCQICDAVYKHKTALKKHERTVHERSGVIFCAVCHRTFSSQEKLDWHKRVHLSRQRRKCVYCGKQFTPIKSLLIHELRCSSSKSFSCEICSFSTKLKHTLIVHMRHHTGEKPYLCQRCGKRWPSKSDLTAHEKTHSDQRPYECQFCEKTYRRNSHLRRHENLHTGEKSYKCKFCFKSFISPDAKVYHEKRKHLGMKDYGESKVPYRDMPKRYKCSYCDQKFVMTSERSLHERERHTGEKPFSCSICGKKFSRKRRGISHVLSKHKELGCVTRVDSKALIEIVRPRPKRKCRQKSR